MSKNILIMGFACLSVMAVAQTSSNGKASNNTAPGVATGRRMHEPLMPSAQKSSGQKDRTSSTPSVSEGVAPATNSNGGTRVATGDVNGDGRADVTASANKQNSSSNQNGASDDAAQKKGSDGIHIMKQTDAASPTVAPPPSDKKDSGNIQVTKTTDSSSTK